MHEDEVLGFKPVVGADCMRRYVRVGCQLSRVGRTGVALEGGGEGGREGMREGVGEREGR